VPERAVTLVVGMGNPILGDDGVGWRVIDVLEARLAGDPAVELDRRAVGGVALMERLVGYHRAVIVDAFPGGDEPPGTTWCRPLEGVVTRTASHLDSQHDEPLSAALRTGRAMGAELPHQIEVVGIAIVRAAVFSERLSGPVAAAVETAADLVLGAVRGGGAGRGDTETAPEEPG
jgi:hydrogenase maturation protease